MLVSETWLSENLQIFKIQKLKLQIKYKKVVNILYTILLKNSTIFVLQLIAL